MTADAAVKLTEEQNLEQFLRKFAEEKYPHHFETVEFSGTKYQDVKEYHEDVNPDALTDAWLDNGTSYIYKVGTLAIIDWNKADYVRVVIGILRDERRLPEVVGEFYFHDGENMDIGRVIKRAVGCLQLGHPVFEDR